MQDPNRRPPESIRNLFKTCRKLSPKSSDTIPDAIDTRAPDEHRIRFLPEWTISRTEVQDLEHGFSSSQQQPEFTHLVCDELAPYPPFEVNGLPGLYVFPSLLSPRLQISLLDKLLHRDLSNPAHRTNLHLHYDISYPGGSGDHGDRFEMSRSFFNADRHSSLRPKDPSMHKPIDYTQMLEGKLRWLTLGGQYDWTNKVYPQEAPPAFPPDIAALLKKLFPHVDAQAAIVNLYRPGDTLSVHRDVSEECDRSLISISIGCDGIFIVGNDDGTQLATLRLRSGDAIVMSAASRYAWHAVPKIVPDTCPTWLRDWPDIPNGSQYSDWQGWMANKRINLNVRQMKDG